MKDEGKDQIVFLALIAGRKQKDLLLTMLSESGVQLATTLYGKGSVKVGYLKNVLGLVPEENKVVIISVATNQRANAVLKKLVDDFHFDRPNTGIAFTMPIDKLSF